MGFLSNEKIIELQNKISSDPELLRKLYKAKKNSNYERTVEHNLVDQLLKDGWQIQSTLKTKTILSKAKNHSKKFEDEIWAFQASLPLFSTER